MCRTWHFVLQAGTAQSSTTRSTVTPPGGELGRGVRCHGCLPQGYNATAIPSYNAGIVLEIPTTIPVAEDPKRRCKGVADILFSMDTRDHGRQAFEVDCCPFILGNTNSDCLANVVGLHLDVSPAIIEASNTCSSIKIVVSCSLPDFMVSGLPGEGLR